MNTIPEIVAMSLSIVAPICAVFGKVYYDLKNEISDLKPGLRGNYNTTLKHYYMSISNEVYDVKQMLLKDYLDKHIEVGYSIGDCISVNDEIWEIDRIGYCEEKGKGKAIKIEAMHKPKIPKESEGE